MEFDQDDIVDCCDKLVENHKLVRPTTTALSQSKVNLYTIIYMYWYYTISIKLILVV